MASISRIGVVGGGTMGRGIAQAAAVAGYETTLVEVAEQVMAAARADIERSTAKAVEKGKLDAAGREAALGRIRYERGTGALDACDLVVEAVPESLALKSTIFEELSRICPAQAILASNTSSLSIDALAPAGGRPALFAGMHFFNPVPLMRLIEIVRGRETSDDTVAALIAVAERMGKTAIVVRDSPGFATSRLGVVIGLEAIRMLEQEVASAKDIDTAMELGYNHPMGPLRLTDLVGLDVRLAIAEYLHATLGGEQYRPPELLRQMVADGKLGKKSGQGFHRWDPA